MRKTLIALLLAFTGALPASAANVSVTIGIDVPAYPTLQRIPSYPVYYAPSLRANYFFYDGLYWVFDGGDWYSSTWYNGPWYQVDRYEVPTPLLRVPVRYYRSKPVSFRSHRLEAAPHWHEHWGQAWAQRRSDWERWDVRRAPAPAPLPAYQRQYTRERYPVVEQQYVIQSRNYRYEPRDPVVQEVYRERRARADAYVAPGVRRADAGPPAHAPAYGFREREARWNERRDDPKEREKDQRERAKERDKDLAERAKDQREAERERAKDQREAEREREKEAREREKDARERDRERDKDARERDKEKDKRERERERR